MKAFIVLGLVLLIACQQASTVCPDGTVVSAGTSCPAIPAPNAPSENVAVTPPAQPPNIVEQPKADFGSLPKDVRDLVTRSETKLKSITFLYAPVIETSTGFQSVAGHTYHVLGTNVRVDANRGTVFHPDTFIDTVYLDLSTRSAQGFCLNGNSAICSRIEQRSADYDEYLPKMPLHWLVLLPSSARIVGDENYENRAVKRVRFSLEDKQYEYLIDPFSGVPFKVSIFSDTGFKNLVGGAEYRDVVVNLVTAEDVAPPTNVK